MGRSAGVRPNCSLNNGKKWGGEQPEVQADSLTQRLVSEFWACQNQNGSDQAALGDQTNRIAIAELRKDGDEDRRVILASPKFRHQPLG